MSRLLKAQILPAFLAASGHTDAGTLAWCQCPRGTGRASGHGASGMRNASGLGKLFAVLQAARRVASAHRLACRLARRVASIGTRQRREQSMCYVSSWPRPALAAPSIKLSER